MKTGFFSILIMLFLVTACRVENLTLKGFLEFKSFFRARSRNGNHGGPMTTTCRRQKHLEPSQSERAGTIGTTMFAQMLKDNFFAPRNSLNGSNQITEPKK